MWQTNTFKNIRFRCLALKYEKKRNKPMMYFVKDINTWSTYSFKLNLSLYYKNGWEWILGNVQFKISHDTVRSVLIVYLILIPRNSKNFKIPFFKLIQKKNIAFFALQQEEPNIIKFSTFWTEIIERDKFERDWSKNHIIWTIF